MTDICTPNKGVASFTKLKGCHHRVYKDACPCFLLPYSVYYINPALTTCAYRSVRCIGAAVISRRIVNLKSRLNVVAEGTEPDQRVLD